MMLKWDDKLIKGLGSPLPKNANPVQEYLGTPFIKATPATSQIYLGEDLLLKVHVMGDLGDPMLHWRYLGGGSYQSIPLKHRGRSVFEAIIENPEKDFEYYLEAGLNDQKMVFPVSAPVINNVVIVIDRAEKWSNE